MKRTRTAISFSLVLAVTFLLTSKISSEEDSKSADDLIKQLYPDGVPSDNFFAYPYEFSVVPESRQGPLGSTKLIFAIKNNICQNLKVDFAKNGKLTLETDLPLPIECKIGDSQKVTFDILIAPNDTSEITIEIKSDKSQRTMSVFYVSNSNLFRYELVDPEYSLGSKSSIGRDMSDPPKTDEVWKGVGNLYYEDEDGNLVPIDSIVNGLSPRGKRVGAFNKNGKFVPLDSLSIF